MSRLYDRQTLRVLRLGLVLALGASLFAGLLLLLDAVPTSSAALAEPVIRYVDDDTGNDMGNQCVISTAPCATIQYAMDVATAGDEIRLAAGTYTSTDSTNVLNITQSITIVGGFEPPDWSTSVSSTTTRIDGEGARRGISVTKNVGNVVIANLMVRGGQTENGAGLFVNSGNWVDIRDAKFEDNRADDWNSPDDNRGGGGICTLGDITLNRVEMVGNYGLRDGGGIYVDGGARAMLIDTKLISNTASHRGGGIYSGGQSTVFNSIIKYNITTLSADGFTWTLGGGGIWTDGHVTLEGTQVVSNTSAYHGGGLLLCSKSGYWECQSGSTLTATNTLIAGNQAELGGGGFYVVDTSSPLPHTTSRLLHTTIARNRSRDGSGVYVMGANSTVALTNTVLVSHTVGITVAAGNTATLEATLWGADAWANRTDWAGAGTVLTGTINLWGDPAFVDPDAEDYHIRIDSAAIDVGVNAGVREDIDGDPRPMGCGYDIGTDELLSRYCLYLPLVLRNHPPPVDFPLPIGGAIPQRPVAYQGEVFYSLPAYVPVALPPGGHFYFSSRQDAVAEVLVDDLLAVRLGGVDDFAYDFADGVLPRSAIVEVPRTQMEQWAGQTVVVEYRDVYGNMVEASEMWLIWMP